MGKSSGEQSTTTVQKADPWEGVQPALRELYSSALSNFYGPGPQYYPNSTVAPQSPTTSLYQDLLFGRALSGSPLTGQAQDQAYSTLGDDYMLNPASLGTLSFGLGNYADFNPAIQSLYSLAGRDFNDLPGMNQLGQLAGSDFMSNNWRAQRLEELSSRDFFGSTPGMSQLQDIAGGSMLNANPYVDTMFNKAASNVGRQFSENVMPGIASMYSGAGRFGSNQMAGGLDQAQQQYGNTLNNLATDIYGQNYANERGFQQQAMNQLGQFGLASTGLQQQGLNQLLGMGLQSRGMQQQAAGQLGQFGLANQNAIQQMLSQLGQFGLTGQGLQQQAFSDLGTQLARERAYQMQALGMAPQLANMDYFDLGQLGQLGQGLDAYSQQLLGSDINRYNYYQNLPNQELQFLNSILNGGLTLSGSTGTTTQPSQGSSPLMGAMGGASLGHALFAGNPWGMAAGALLGLF